MQTLVIIFIIITGLFIQLTVQVSKHCLSSFKNSLALNFRQ